MSHVQLNLYLLLLQQGAAVAHQPLRAYALPGLHLHVKWLAQLCCSYAVKAPAKLISILLRFFGVVQFVTPQWALTEPFAINDTTILQNQFPPPRSSNVKNYRAYKAQADDVLKKSAALTPELTAEVELFDNKGFSLGFPYWSVMNRKNISSLDAHIGNFLNNVRDCCTL